MKYLHLIGCLIVMSLVQCKSSGQTSSIIKAKMDSLLQINNPRSFSGVVLISKNGNTIYSNAIGFADSLNSKAINLSDEFVLLSNSKQITAVLVLQAVDKGLINLNNPIKNYLPELTMSWADSVTVHQLLNHSGGLTGKNEPLLFAPGTDFKYSDINYILLGKIIEAVEKQSYAQLVTQLFEKVGMQHSYFPNFSNQQNLIIGNKYIGTIKNKSIDSVIIPLEKIPAAGLVSTAGDMTIWNNTLHNGKLISPAAYRLMTSYTITGQHVTFGPDKIGYGYALRVNDGMPVKYFGHTGTAPDQGFTSLTLWFPEEKISVVILENQAYDNMEINYWFETEIRKLICDLATKGNLSE